MTALKQLFLNSLNQDGQNFHYKSSEFDLSFISFQKKIYFILAKNDDVCVTGTVEKKDNELSFDLNDKRSLWLKVNSDTQQVLQLMEEKYSFMQPIKTKGIKP